MLCLCFNVMLNTYSSLVEYLLIPDAEAAAPLSILILHNLVSIYKHTTFWFSYFEKHATQTSEECDKANCNRFLIFFFHVWGSLESNIPILGTICTE